MRAVSDRMIAVVVLFPRGWPLKPDRFSNNLLDHRRNKYPFSNNLLDYPRNKDLFSNNLLDYPRNKDSIGNYPDNRWAESFLQHLVEHLDQGLRDR